MCLDCRPPSLSRVPHLLSFPVLCFPSSLLPPEQLTYLPTALYLTCFCLCHAMWHAGFWFPDQGWTPCPLQWKRGVLATGPSEKSLSRFFMNSSSQGSLPNLFCTAASF